MIFYHKEPCMQKFVLQREVTILGKNIFGKQAYLTVAPSQQRGWWWQYDKHENPICITSDLVESGFRRMRLVYCRPSDGKLHFLQCCQHILALRWRELDRVVLQSSAWPPYFGSVLGYWQKLRDHCTVSAESCSWFMPPTTVTAVYYRDRNRWTKISPHRSELLTVSIIVDYPELGRHTLEWSSDLNQEWLYAPTQGWPPLLQHPLRWLPQFLWPHYDQILWPGKYAPKDTLKLFAWHRLTDLLGALSVIHPTSLPSAQVISHCSGHRADVEAVKRINL